MSLGRFRLLLLCSTSLGEVTAEQAMSMVHKTAHRLPVHALPWPICRAACHRPGCTSDSQRRRSLDEMKMLSLVTRAFMSFTASVDDWSLSMWPNCFKSKISMNMTLASFGPFMRSAIAVFNCSLTTSKFEMKSVACFMTSLKPKDLGIFGAYSSGHGSDSGMGFNV